MNRRTPLRRTWRRPERRQERGSWGGTRAPITFPTSELGVRVWIALGADPSNDPSTWSWENITARVRYAAGISKRTGRPDESSTVTGDELTLTLDNSDGTFCRRNPSSVYYGLLTKHNPIWVEVDPGDGGFTWAEFFVNEWPTRWSSKGLDSTAPIVCGGAFRRVQATPGESWSALKRTIMASDPVAYWPLEDDSGATKAASATGGLPMTSSGAVEFGAVTSLIGSAQAPDLSAPAALFGSIGSGSGSAWHCEFLIKATFGNSAIARIYTSSNAFACYRIFWPPDGAGNLQVFITAADQVTVIAALTTGAAVGAGWDQTWHHIAVTSEQSGSNVVINLYIDGALYNSTTAAGALGACTDFYANHLLLTSVESFAHISIGNGVGLSGMASALAGYDGEQAHVRVARLCNEEGVRFIASGSVTRSEAMGAQGVDALVPLLRECEAADMGVLYETNWGLTYQTRAERYNQPVALSMDFDLGHISDEPEPADDDQQTTNRWKVSRASGSSATFEETDGPLGTGAIDVWPGEVTINVADDNQLSEQAAWRTHMTTVDEDRWPRIDIKMHASPDLIPQWSALPSRHGAHVQIAHPPAEGPPDTIDALIEGVEERIDPHTWDLSLNTSPANPFNVGAYGSGNDPNGSGTDRYDTAGSQTGAPFTSGTDTSMTVATTRGAIWTTDADDLPFRIKVGGVVLEVTAISGASSPQTFTITPAAINGQNKLIPTGEAISLAEPAYYAL